MHPITSSLRLYCLKTLVLLCLWLGMPLNVTATEGISPTSPESPPLVLTTRGDHLSLHAVDVPLKEVIARIGQALHIPVSTYIGPQDRVSAEFQDLSLKEALKRLAPNYALLLDEASGKVTRILVFPPRKDLSASAQPQPFRFTFDPLKYMQ